MTTVVSLIVAPGSVAILMFVLIGLGLLIQPSSEPPAELVAAISGWPPPALAEPLPAPFTMYGLTYITMPDSTVRLSPGSWPPPVLR